MQTLRTIGGNVGICLGPVFSQTTKSDYEASMVRETIVLHQVAVKLRPWPLLERIKTALKILCTGEFEFAGTISDVKDVTQYSVGQDVLQDSNP
jgi:hypothetical protein